MDQHSFFYQALVFLAATVIFVPIAKKLGIGSVLGYLLAGIVIGPAVLGFIGEEGQDIMHFAEFGVVMMLFVIGLELEPELLWRLRKSIVGMGGLQVLSATTVIGAVAFFLGMTWQASLALGFSLALSSTAIVMQTLAEKDLLKTAAGQSSFSVLLFQDISVIPMLAIFPLLTIGDTPVSVDPHATPTWVDGKPAWMQTLMVVSVIAGIIVSGIYLVRPVLRFIARTSMREVFTATALLIVIGIAVLMTRVGLSPALGTFLAGVVLANSEYRHELESDIEPFKGLLLGLFFIAVGASINFALIIQQPWRVFGLVLGVMAVKGALLLILGKAFRLSVEQFTIFAFALCQVGEFAFVLLSMSGSLGIVQPDTVSLLIAVVAISMALAPIVMLAADKFILPRVGTSEDPPKEADKFEESNQVIIAGFGEFGNTAGRFLRAHGIKATYLDIDSDRVDVLRKLGFKVYYGDATRYDLLQSAGADKAKLIVIAIDVPEKRLEMIETIKKHFPNLQMLVRASNRFDAYDLMNAGMLHVYRESLDTSLTMAVDVMKMLGFRAYTANRAARFFRKHDEINLKKLAAVRNQEDFLTITGSAIEELERTIRQDRLSWNQQIGDGWDVDTLIEEVNQKD